MCRNSITQPEKKKQKKSMDKIQEVSKKVRKSFKLNGREDKIKICVLQLREKLQNLENKRQVKINREERK